MKIYTIGRSSDADICLGQLSEGGSVSDFHADLVLSAEVNDVLLVDRNSSNGTYVWCDNNWERVSQLKVARDSTVSFGKCRIKLSELISKTN